MMQPRSHFKVGAQNPDRNLKLGLEKTQVIQKGRGQDLSVLWSRSLSLEWSILVLKVGPIFLGSPLIMCRPLA